MHGDFVYMLIWRRILRSMIPVGYFLIVPMGAQEAMADGGGDISNAVQALSFEQCDRDGGGAIAGMLVSWIRGKNSK